MPNDEFNYIDDSLVNKKKKRPLKILIIILVILALATFVYFLILPNISHEKKTTSDDSPSEYVGVDKVYDKESGLIIPTNYDKRIYERKKMTLDATNIKADKTGYIISLTFNNNSSNAVTINCVAVLIDGFETSANFSLSSSQNVPESTTITIPKTELDLLEINDFNNLSFLIDFNSNKEDLNFNEIITLYTNQIDPVDNTKKIIKFDELTNIDVSVFDKKEDAEYSYIYFDIKNKSYQDTYNIMVNKLYVNGKIYNYDNLEEIVHYQADRIFYLKIPKREYPKIEKMNISFFFLKNKDTIDQSIIISNLKEIIVNNL